MMEFKHTIIHIRRRDNDKCYTVSFSYDEEFDVVCIEKQAYNIDHDVLGNASVSKVIKYAMLEQRFNDAVYGTGKSDEIDFYMEDYYEMTNEKDNISHPSTTKRVKERLLGKANKR